MGRDKPFACEKECGGFGLTETLFRAASSVAGSRFDLDDDKLFAVEHDQIELTSFAMPVRRDPVHSLRFQQLSGGQLTTITQGAFRCRGHERKRSALACTGANEWRCS